MPIDLYTYKQGCRSTPKLRRNQSKQKYCNNPSIDSFTSLRPNSPGLHSLLSSPTSPEARSPSSLSLERYELPSPAYTRYPAGHSRHASLDAIMSPLEPVVVNPFQPMQSDFGDREEEDSRQSSDPFRSAGPNGHNHRHKSTSEVVSAVDGNSNAARHVKSMCLLPNQVAVIKDAMHESNVTQIYDWQGNEISYRFGGTFSHFKLEYELDEPSVEGQSSQGGRWKMLKKWRKGLKDAVKTKFNEAKRYDVETWRRKL